MKNPIHALSAYKVTGALHNPITGDTWSTCIIVVSYSKSGMARAWWGYSDHCIATAGGYGYDKESTVLARAVAKLSGHEMWQSGGVGVSNVIGRAAVHGVTVEKLI